MITSHLIYQNQTRHQELLHQAAIHRALNAHKENEPSAMSQVLARTGDLLVTVGQGLQRRYRRMEQGVGMAEYASGQGWGQAQ